MTQLARRMNLSKSLLAYIKIVKALIRVSVVKKSSAIIAKRFQRMRRNNYIRKERR